MKITQESPSALGQRAVHTFAGLLLEHSGQLPAQVPLHVQHVPVLPACAVQLCLLGSSWALLL